METARRGTGDSIGAPTEAELGIDFIYWIAFTIAARPFPGSNNFMLSSELQ